MTVVHGLLAAAIVAALLLTAGSAVAKPDPRSVFYTDDTTWYTSPWFGGQHRIMTPFGCTEAPYYSPGGGLDTATYPKGLLALTPVVP